jgi:hypothetical protein
MRVIDRAAILEEIEQHKLLELRQNLSNVKSALRKQTGGGKNLPMNVSATDKHSFNSSFHQT